MTKTRSEQAVDLRPDERQLLAHWTRNADVAPDLALRARILLACGRGSTNARVAADLHVNAQTVSKWRCRFRRDRMAGIFPDPRIDARSCRWEDAIREILRHAASAAGEPPSTRSLAGLTGFSQSKVSRLIRGLALFPTRCRPAESSRIRFDPGRAECISGVYLDSSDQILVLVLDPAGCPHFPADESVDDGRPSPGRPPVPWLPATANLTEAVARQVLALPSRRADHRGVPALSFLDGATASVPSDREVHLIASRTGISNRMSLRRWLARHPRARLHRLPPGLPWSRLLASWIDALRTRDTDPISPALISSLESALTNHLDLATSSPSPFLWVRDGRQGRILSPRRLALASTLDTP